MGLGGRLAAAFAGLVATTALLVGGASYVTTDRQVTDEIDEFLRDRADEIAEGQRAGPPGRGDRDRNRSDGILAVEPDAEVQLLDEAGQVESNTGLALPVDAGDLVLADKNEKPRLRTVTIDGVEYRMITQHIGGGGAVQVARSLEESNALLDVLRSRLSAVALLMAAVAAGCGWLVARRITKPLRSLTESVDTVAATQDLTVAVDQTGGAEVGRLAGGFNQMLDALRTSREQQHRLVQDAAHELRTPLTSIKANIDWLSRADAVDPATRAEVMQGVRRELGELNEVISEIVELATDRRELPPFEPVDLADVARSAVDRFRERTDRTVELRAEPTIVPGVPDALRRAITNLLSNADKYSPPGAPVLVEVGAEGVWVSDRGPGIPPEERPLVFDRFYRRDADRSRPGSGLGLSIVADVVEAHGGEVEVGDAAAGGARVGFRLTGSAPGQ